MKIYLKAEPTYADVADYVRKCAMRKLTPDVPKCERARLVSAARMAQRHPTYPFKLSMPVSRYSVGY